MALEQIAGKVIEADVLVMGGGIAGCCVAAKAARNGLKVVLAEKAKTDRSGSAAAGIDHYGNYPPRTRSFTPVDIPPDEFAGIWKGWQAAFNWEGQYTDPNSLYRLYKYGFWTLEELEKLGITSKWHDGEYYWMPSAAAWEGAKGVLRVHWTNIKPMLAKAARKSGVNILERTMVVDLLTNSGKVVGATAVNTRTGEFIVIKAKAVVLATGLFTRCYDGETPLFWKYKFRYHWCPATISGDGYAVAYRAGAELAHMEVSGYTFRMRDDLTISFGNFVRGDGIPAKQYTWDGERTPYLPGPAQYEDLEQKGRTPLYFSLQHLPDDFHKRMEIAFADERLVSFKIAEERGFNPRIHRYDLMAIQSPSMHMASGVNTDEYFRTTLPGLYAVGDCAAGFHNCGMATVSALLLADDLPGFISKASEPVVDETQVESQKQTALAPLNIKDGTEPMELESAVRYACERYIGFFKSEGKLREGLRRLGSLQRVFLPQLMAKNPHYLMRCLEVRNILDLAEVHVTAVLERKETRSSSIRLDYPEVDPSLGNMRIYQRREDGKPVLEIRKAPELKPEYTKGGK